MPTVFFSYARADVPAVDRIADDLVREGIEVWLDRQNLRAGEFWQDQIEQAIGRADFILVFLSHDSLQLKWVQAEYRAAFQKQQSTGGNRVIPVLLEKVNLPPFLAAIRIVDFTESYFDGMRELLEVLQAPSGPKPELIVPVANLAKEVAGEIAKILRLEHRQPPADPVRKADPKLVFVIMSFQPDMEPIFEGIDAAASLVGLSAKRIKDVPGDYRINDQIVQMIETARLIVADLSQERPNVYFELGYARGIRKQVITIARQGTTIHFDVKDWTCMTYIDSRVLERDLVKRFEYELSQSNANDGMPT